MPTTSELQTTGRVGFFLGNGVERTKKGRLGLGRTEDQKIIRKRSVTNISGIISTQCYDFFFHMEKTFI